MVVVAAAACDEPWVRNGPGSEDMFRLQQFWGLLQAYGCLKMGCSCSRRHHGEQVAGRDRCSDLAEQPEPACPPPHTQDSVDSIDDVAYEITLSVWDRAAPRVGAPRVIGTRYSTPEERSEIRMFCMHYALSGDQR